MIPRTVADRGTSRISATSPKSSPRPSSCRSVPSMVTITRPLMSSVPLLAGISLSHDYVTGRDLDPPGFPGDGLEGRTRKGAKQWSRPEDRHLCDGNTERGGR